MKKTILFLATFLITNIVSAQQNVVYVDEDIEIFNQYISYILEKKHKEDLDYILENTAIYFLEKPYVAHRLEIEGNEKLVVNLREFDCTTFVETVIALSQTVSSKVLTFENFINKLETLRYREGVLDGYSSRLHYFTDWIFDNEQVGLLKDITIQLGGITEKKSIDFMSTHRDAYSQLKVNDETLNKIIDVEKVINDRGIISYIPKANIDDITNIVPHMSVLAFSTSIKGLDVTHTGFVFQKGGKLTFIHASSSKNKVIIDSLSISEYCNSQKSCTGIILAKLL